MNALRQRLQELAAQIGLVLLGIGPARPPAAHLAVYDQWLAAGHQAGMAYLARPDTRAGRTDPARLLPGAQSVVVVGLRHSGPPPLATAPGPEFGRIAAYAWGRDYHQVLPEKLQILADCLQADLPGLAWKAVTDSAPLLERSLAWQAGLGWIGRNTCLISPQWGSFLLLGELLLDRGLEFEAPFSSDHCGSCQRCINACPTGCIGADRTLDARRCLAYLTIEHKGAIPAELRPALGSQIFGCDICQQVCPWNRKWLDTPGDAALAPRPELVAPRLIPELELGPAAFQARFQETPILRTRRRGYLRNVALALGNSQDTSAVPVLGHVLQMEEEALIRAAAAWALGRINTPAGRQALEEAKKKEGEPEVRVEILAALQNQ
ncbi:MAG TPA: tRNA epoxyqueuosine(34) reductase QueG [Anaerolineaceae bacterium]|nr:tRNA epoxyqueuosine(34) reductase QueG [Anaerolineaceae bacterium]